MQVPTSDADFYERKIYRLEKDLAEAIEQLNACRGRLRLAEDFQIKYQLLLRQSQQQNLAIRKREELDKARINEIIMEEIDKINKQWMAKMQENESRLQLKFEEERRNLVNQVEQLTARNKELAEKADQMQVLLLKNKKIVKDLEILEEIIEQNRVNSERQRQDELRQCRDSITRRYEQRIQSQKQKHESIITEMEERISKLELQSIRVSILEQEVQKAKQPWSRPFKTEKQLTQRLQKQIQKLGEAIRMRDGEIEKLQNQKIELEEKHSERIRQLNQYNKTLENELYSAQTRHELEIMNFKSRMEEARKVEIYEKQKQCELIEKQHIRDIEAHNERIEKQKAELEHIRKIEEAEIAKLKNDKQVLQSKIAGLKERLKEYETNQGIGETQMLINSLKNIDRREDDMDGYENGVTFLERQLKKTNIKLERKNQEIKDLLDKINNINAEYQKQIAELKQKYAHQVDQSNKKEQGYEQQVKGLNEQIRKKQRANRDIETEYEKQITQLTAENRSLQNINSDLQRDYNRILESKKVIEKSFREERQRSVTSKSQVAIAKKQKFLELERQKNEIEIIYKQKEEQLKTGYEIVVSELQAEVNMLKRQNELLRQQAQSLKTQCGQNQSNKGKENVLSDYHKKLASVNLEIALTENLYNSLIKAKSRLRKQEKESPPQATMLQSKVIGNELESKAIRFDEGSSRRRTSEPIYTQTKSQMVQQHNKQSANNKNQLKSEKSQRLQIYSKTNRLSFDFQKFSQNQSNRVLSSKGVTNEQPLYLDRDELGQIDSPTFQMMQSFNPHFK